MTEQPRTHPITVLCAGGFRLAMEKVVAEFEGTSGLQVTGTYVPPARLKEMLREDTADVVIAVSSTLDPVEDAPFMDASTRCHLATASLALALPAASSRVSVGTLAEFGDFLLSVPSVALSDPRAGTPAAKRIFEAARQHGLDARLAGIVRYIMGPGREVALAVARGEAASGITLGSEIEGIDGVRNSGRLPPEMQHVVQFDMFSPPAPRNAPQATKLREFVRRHGPRIGAGSGLEFAAVSGTTD